MIIIIYKLMINNDFLSLLMMLGQCPIVVVFKETKNKMIIGNHDLSIHYMKPIYFLILDHSRHDWCIHRTKEYYSIVQSKMYSVITYNR